MKQVKFLFSVLIIGGFVFIFAPSTVLAASVFLKFDFSNDYFSEMDANYPGAAYAGGKDPNDLAKASFSLKTGYSTVYLGQAKDATDKNGGSAGDGWTSHSFDISEYLTKSGRYHFQWQWKEGWDSGHVKNFRVEVNETPFYDDARGSSMGNATDGAGAAGDGGDYVDHYVTINLGGALSNGQACSQSADCQSGYCGQNGICCNSGEFCCSKEDNTGCPMTHRCEASTSLCIGLNHGEGDFCYNDYSCKNGLYCVHNTCRASKNYCGDNYCDEGETCASCAKDCKTGCKSKLKPPAKITFSIGKKQFLRGEKAAFAGICAGGSKCSIESDVFSGRGLEIKSYPCKLQSVITMPLQPSPYRARFRCCNADESACIESKWADFVVVAKDGESCQSERYCVSGNCRHFVCCAKGKNCCDSKAENICPAGQYCSGEKFYCEALAKDGKPCQSDKFCQSGYCGEDGICRAKEQIKIIMPAVVSLKKTQKFYLPIAIQNLSDKEIILGEQILISTGSRILELNAAELPLVIHKTRLAPGESVSTAAEDLLESIGSFSFSGKAAGEDNILMDIQYFVDNQSKWIKKKIKVAVSKIHIQTDEAASELYGLPMLFEAKQKIKDSKNGRVKEYIFIKPENDKSFNSLIQDWQYARNEAARHLRNLVGDYGGLADPEIVSYFKTVKELNQARTPDEIVEITGRAVAAPLLTAAADYIKFNKAMEEQERIERVFLTNYFPGGFFSFLPNYDKKGKVIGYQKVILKEAGSKLYAIKLGD